MINVQLSDEECDLLMQILCEYEDRSPAIKLRVVEKYGEESTAASLYEKQQITARIINNRLYDLWDQDGKERLEKEQALA